MISASLRRLSIAALALAALAGPALAQSPACNSWRSELASLQGQRSGGDPRAARAAQRVGAQLSQAINQYRAMGCERSGFLIFGNQPPPQCGGMRAQIGQLQGQFASLQQQAQGDGSVEQRRAQLAAAIDNNCRGQSRGFFDTIFGMDQRPPGEIESTIPELDPRPLDQDQQPARAGGPYSVCVRTCDGFFFPLANSPGGREGQDEMCQALCPGAETTAYGMTNGGDIQNAMSRRGVPYSALPNAGKYQRSFDAACTCRAPGQSWAQALQHAEEMIETRKGDIIVTEQRSNEMARPRAEQANTKRRAGQPAPAPAAAAPVPAAPTTLTAEPGDEPAPAASVPTAGTESAGVGPQVVEGQRTVQRGDGIKSESKNASGERRTVRIVAPNIAPNLGAATARP